MYCNEGAHISNVGWRIWEGNENHLTCYFAEYKCSGPGYTPASRISWSHQLTDEQAAAYTMENIFAKNTALTAAGAAYFADDWTPTDVVSEIKSANETGKAHTYYLEQNYPNPFNPSTVITYQVPANGPVSLKVYTILGKEVATLVNEDRPAGHYEVRFNASELPSGIYFYSLRAGMCNITKKMLFIK